MLKIVVDQIKWAVKKGDQISPFLFICKSASENYFAIQQIITELQEAFDLPSSYISSLDDDEKAIKVSQVRLFIEKSFIKPDYGIQIFVIHDISRLTSASGNALLKFFEEPWIWNIIFLSNASQSAVLDTILSRVQTIVVPVDRPDWVSEEIFSLIEKYVVSGNTEIVSYYYLKNSEKKDALDFLYALLIYIKKTWNFSELIEKIDQDITGISQNNFLPKYVIDSYIIRLTKEL